MSWDRSRLEELPALVVQVLDAVVEVVVSDLGLLVDSVTRLDLTFHLDSVEVEMGHNRFVETAAFQVPEVCLLEDEDVESLVDVLVSVVAVQDQGHILVVDEVHFVAPMVLRNQYLALVIEDLQTLG